MGSIKKRTYYEKLHERYGEKYPLLHVTIIKQIRGRTLNPKNKHTKQQIITSFEETLSNIDKEILMLNSRKVRLQNGITFLKYCEDDQFADLTKVSTKFNSVDDR